jgi:hypothetical protein
MSYYDNPQWSATGQQNNNNNSSSNNNWDHQGTTTPVRAGASAPQPQDDYAFSYQFDEVDRAYENLQKSGKGFIAGGRHGNRMPHSGGSRSHSMNFDAPPGGQGGPNLHNFYASQRHQSSRGSNEAEQVMQAKRRMAAQRERELRNLHTEQQYQRTVVTDMNMPGNPNNANPNPVPSNHHNNGGNNNNNNHGHNNGGNKQMTEEESRELIARQRSALYGEGPFADKSGYVDENGNVRPGVPGHSGPSSLRGHSPMTFDGMGRAPPSAEARTPGSAVDPTNAPADPSPRPQSTTSPSMVAPNNKVFDNAMGPQSRTSTSSPTGGSPPRDLAPGSKAGQSGANVAPIGTRPSGTPTNGAASKRSTTPMGTSGGWGRGNGVWGQSSGLGAQASVWG